MYGNETWSVTSKEKHRLKVSQKKVQRSIFRLKRDEVTRGCNVDGHVAHVGVVINAYRMLVRKSLR
jgi:hypothetical protein